MNNFGGKNGTSRHGMFKRGMSILILAVFVLLTFGAEEGKPAAKKKETKKEMQARLAQAALNQKQKEDDKKRQEKEAKEAAERAARGYIEVLSLDVTGNVLLNGNETTYTVSSGDSVTLTIENANGEYKVAVKDSNGTVWQANRTVNLSGGSREKVSVEDPNYVTSPNDLTYVQNTGGGLTITGYKGNSRKVVIPATISGVRVTEIGENAFGRKYKWEGNRWSDNYGQFVFEKGQRPSLVSLIIPNSVTSIGRVAFAGNNELASLIIPDSVTSIGVAAFHFCGLSSLVLGNRVTSIGAGAFYKNALTTVNIPNSITSIEASVFGNNKFTTITIPNSVTSIGSGAFSSNALTTVTIPNSVTVIQPVAFGGNPITTIVIPPSLAKSGQNIGFRQAFFSASWEDNYRWDFDRGSACNATSVTLPANVDNENLTTNFEQGLLNFYISQNKRAGTYTKEDGIWKLTTPR